MTADQQQPAQPPEIEFTDDAVDKLTEVIEGHANPVAGLRLQIVGRAGGEFQHVLSMVEDGAQPEGDVEVETEEGIRVFVEPRSAPYVNGIVINYAYKGAEQSGLEFTNPNPLWFQEEEQTIQRLFDEYINPSIAAHGGYVNLLGVEGTTAFVQLGGGCVGCGMADVTLKQGIEVAIKESVPSIERVIDATDHASGENPYYKPSKK